MQSPTASSSKSKGKGKARAGSGSKSSRRSSRSEQKVEPELPVVRDLSPKMTAILEFMRYMLLEEATVNEGEDSVQTFGRLFEAFLLEIESMDPKNLKRLGDIADAHREIYSSTPAAIQYLSDFFYEICVQARIDPQTVGREVFGREVGDELDKDFINATTRVHLQRTIAITEKKAKSNEKGSKAARKLYKKMMEDLVRI